MITERVQVLVGCEASCCNFEEEVRNWTQVSSKTFELIFEYLGISEQIKHYM